MKVAELRQKLGALKKEEILKLAVEFYKLVPKAKKEDYDLDNMINNPDSKKKKVSKAALSLVELEPLILTFITNVKDQNYLVPNRIVPKKERSTWRFKVKKWYKELIDLSRADANISMQANLLQQLYEVLCESCGYNYFSAYDTFESLKITQTDFYKSVLLLLDEAKGKPAVIKKGIPLIVDNYVNRYTLYSGLMMRFIEFLPVPDSKYQAIEYTQALIKENNFNPPKQEKNRYSFLSDDNFRKMEKHNNLVELIFRLRMALQEEDEAITYFKTHHYQHRDEEIKIYILISNLFRYNKPELIKREIEAAQQKGIEPRKNLLTLLKHIKTHDSLPEYM